MTKNYAIMHVRRVKSVAGLVRLDKHCRREIGGKEKWQARPELEEKNAFLEQRAYDRYKKFMSSLKFVRKPQENASKALEWVFTSSQEVKGQESYLDVCLEFVKEKNLPILGVYYHFDESVGHLHVLTLPAVQEGDRWRYSAEKILGKKKDMEALQDEFFEFLRDRNLHLVFARGEKKASRERPRHSDLGDYLRKKSVEKNRQKGQNLAL